MRKGTPSRRLFVEVCSIGNVGYLNEQHVGAISQEAARSLIARYRIEELRKVCARNPNRVPSLAIELGRGDALGCTHNSLDRSARKPG